MTDTEKAWVWAQELASRQPGIASPRAFIAALRDKYSHPEQASLPWWKSLEDAVEKTREREGGPPASGEERKAALDEYLKTVGRTRGDIARRAGRSDPLDK